MQVKPLLSIARVEDELRILEDKLKAEHDALVKEEKIRKELETNNVKLLQEKNDIFLQLEAERAGFGDLEERLNKALSQKADLACQLTVSGKICINRDHVSFNERLPIGIPISSRTIKYIYALT